MNDKPKKQETIKNNFKQNVSQDINSILNGRPKHSKPQMNKPQTSKPRGRG